MHDSLFLEKKEHIDYSDTSSLAVPAESKCIATSERMSGFEIKIVYEDREGLDGTWNANTKTIMLDTDSGEEVNTIAHEVSHAVDDIMIWYDFKDPHYEAWLQGSYTSCVWQVVQSKLRAESNFKFYDDSNH